MMKAMSPTISGLPIFTRTSAPETRQLFGDVLSAQERNCEPGWDAATQERAVGGVTHGLLELGDTVTWRARHLGVTQYLTSRISVFDRPRHFRDSQVRGAFRRFDHDHYFEPASDGGTDLRDVFDFEAPFGVLGRLAGWLFLTAYMRRFLTRRVTAIKSAAESPDQPTAPR